MSELPIEIREQMYANDVIRSFLPKGVKLEDCEHTVIDWKKYEKE